MIIWTITMSVIAIMFWLYWPNKMTGTTCGHTYRRKSYKLILFGREIELKPPRSKIEYCHDCMVERAFRCCSCGNPMIAGERFIMAHKNPDILDHTIDYPNDPEYGVGCIRCAEMPCDAIGLVNDEGRPEILPFEEVYSN